MLTSLGKLQLVTTTSYSFMRGTPFRQHVWRIPRLKDF